MKKKVMAKVVINNTINIYIYSKIILFVLLLAFIFVPIVEAHTLNESVRPVGRQMTVMWSSISKDGAEGKAQIDKVIADLAYTNTDTAVVGFGTMCYILSEMYPKDTLYSSIGGATVRDGKVDYFINKAHEANISVWLSMQGMSLSGDPCALKYLNAYLPKTIRGGILHASKLNWDESEGRRLWREMALFMITHHNFDGFWVEEPYMTITLENTSVAKTALLSWGITNKSVLASHGYDPYNIYNWATNTLPDYAILDMLHEHEKLITLGFKELHDSIRALGPNYAYPNFVIAVCLNEEYFAPNEPPYIIGHRGAMWGVNITELSNKHYIDVWQSESSPATDNVDAYLKHLSYAVDHTPEILHTTGVYITDSAMYPFVNPNIFNQASVIQSNGGSYEAIFANVHMYRDCIRGVEVNNSITRCDEKLPLTPKEWLHQNPPRKPRNFNPTGQYPSQELPILVSITIPNSTVVVGDSVTLIATKTNQDNTSNSSVVINWSSSNKNVGTIDSNGMFRALAAGTTTITATSGIVTGTATVVVIESQSITNIIDNPGFELGTASWAFFANGTGSFGVTSPGYEGNNAAILTLNSGGANIQLYQTGVTLESNTSYVLFFAARSSTGHDVTMRLYKTVSPYTNYGLVQTFNLSTKWQTFTTKFNTTGFTGTVNDSRFQFWLSPFGAAGDIYYFDDIRLEKVDIRKKLGDLNNDGIVDINDLWILFGHFNETTVAPYPNYDTNSDENIDIFDIVSVANKI